MLSFDHQILNGFAISMLKCMFQNKLSLKESQSIITEVGLSASFLSRSISTTLVNRHNLHFRD